MALTVENKSIAAKIFNIIFGILRLQNIPTLAVTESEIGDMDFDATTMQITDYSMPMFTMRGFLSRERWGPRSSFPSSTRAAVTEDRMRQVVYRAEKIYKHPEKSEQLVFLLQAQTYLTGSEYAQSFTLSWIIVEKYLSQLWENFLNDKNVNGNREDKLTNAGVWSIDFVIEAMNLAGVLEDNRYKTLMDLKGKRNNFIHRGRSVTRDDSVECLELAKNIVTHDLEGLI